MSAPTRQIRCMGLYSHYAEQQLTELRDRLMGSLHARLTGPTAAGYNGRTVQYQQRTDDIRKELSLVNLELDRRAGRVAAGGPIYLV